MRKGFTLVELIFVITVMGVISAMTFVSISGIYEEMLNREATANIEDGVKVAVEQVTARVSSAIKDSLSAADDLANTNCKGVSVLVAGDNKPVLIWIGRSDESNLGLWDAVYGDYVPGWSGFVDVSSSDNTKIITKGSNLTSAQSIIDSLTGLNNTLNTDPNSPVAVYFHESGSNTNAYNDFFTQTGKMYQVKMNGNTELDFIGANKPTQISEQYTLSHSAYALRLNDTNLTLYSFRPWLGQTPQNDPNPRVIAQNVSNFGFKWDGGIFRINICERNTFVDGFTAEVCKEKAIF